MQPMRHVVIKLDKGSFKKIAVNKFSFKKWIINKKEKNVVAMFL